MANIDLNSLSLMLNLREAGQRSTLQSERAPHFSYNSRNIESWQVRQGQTSGTATSTTLAGFTHWDRTTFHDMIGLDEFDAPLGDTGKDDEYLQDSALGAHNSYEMSLIPIV